MDQHRYLPIVRRKRRKLNIAAPPIACWVPEQVLQPPSRGEPVLSRSKPIHELRMFVTL